MDTVAVIVQVKRDGHREAKRSFEGHPIAAIDQASEYLDGIRKKYR